MTEYFIEYYQLRAAQEDSLAASASLTIAGDLHRELAVGYRLTIKALSADLDEMFQRDFGN